MKRIINIKNEIFKYVCIFFGVALLLIGLIVLLSIYLEYSVILNDKLVYKTQLKATLDHNFILNDALLYKVFLKDTLGYLGAVGGFLAGVGTIIAAIAAAVGVNNWVTQIKHGRVLSAIWDAQITLKKINGRVRFWSVLKGGKKNEEHQKKLEYLELLFTQEFIDLETSSYVLDAMSKKQKTEFYWQCRFRSLLNSYTKIKKHLEKRPLHEDGIAIDTRLNALMSGFKITYDNLLKELNKLEGNHS